jgi:hypothetical protein
MRFLLSLATQKGMYLYQTDIQGAYLQADLNEEIYMAMPSRISEFDSAAPTEGKHVCRILKGIYGLKQSGFAWAKCFKDFMTDNPEYGLNFTPCRIIIAKHSL